MRIVKNPWAAAGGLVDCHAQVRAWVWWPAPESINHQSREQHSF